MNRRHIVLGAITAIVLLAALAVGLKWFSSEPVLTVYLRCDGKVSGTLSIIAILENGEQENQERFDIETVCEAGSFEFQGYPSQKNLQFVFEHRDNATAEVYTEYGRDIQRDQNGFYTVLKIMNAPPFIVNDRI